MTAFVHEGRRSFVVLFAVLAMIAALLAIPATPVNAVTTAACPAAIPSAGFTDLAGFSADVLDGANCLAFYGITKGTSATTYGPSANVSRWQMALFLTRQAEDHGVTLPSGADQGFTDLTGLSAEAETAVNQLAQLNITKGTSATTFDPNGNVGRWQMALFITRLVTGAGITLPSGADQGFTDISGLSAEAQLAINQAAQLAISKGTTATTFDPTGLVTRAQMALFLTRTLEAGGVLPTGLETITVAPSAAAQVQLGTTGKVTQVYTATVVGLTKVSLQLWSGDDVDKDGKLVSAVSTAAATGLISVINGVATGATVSTAVIADVVPSGGVVTFTVEYTAQDPDGAFPAVFSGATVTGIAGATATTPKTPTNDAFGVGGLATVLDAAASTAGPVVAAITAVDKDANWVQAAGETWFYDENDTFTIVGVPKTFADFEKSLSTGDNVTLAPYSATAALVSAWESDDAAPAPPAALAIAADGTTLKLTWTDVAGSTYDVYRSATATGTFSSIASGLTDGKYDDKGLAETTPYWYEVTQTVDGDESAAATGTQTTGTTADTGKPTMVDVDLTLDAGFLGIIDGGETIKIAFSEAMAAGSTAGTFRVSDAEGDVYDIAGVGTLNGADEVLNSVTYTAGKVLTLTTATATLVVDTDADGLDVPGTIVTVTAVVTDVALNTLDVAGSADKVID